MLFGHKGAEVVTRLVPGERSGVFLVTRGCSGHVSGPKGEERPFLVTRNRLCSLMNTVLVDSFIFVALAGDSVHLQLGQRFEPHV